MFQVIGRVWRKKATMIVVVNTTRRVPQISDVTGVIAKEHIADSVAESVRPYADSGAGTVM
jgi:CIC family chloride channel protein